MEPIIEHPVAELSYLKFVNVIKKSDKFPKDDLPLVYLIILLLNHQKSELGGLGR